MQTLTSIWERGWSGQIASLPLSFFVFFDKATGRTVRHTGPKRVVPSKKVPFGGLNDVPLNVGVKSPKTEILGARIGISSLNDKNSNPYNLEI